MELPRRGLVTYTWGNVSGIDPEKGLVVIKPSGVSYEDLTPGKLVVISLDGKVVEGNLNPSSDTKTHLVLYKAFPRAGRHRAHPQPARGGAGRRPAATSPATAPRTPTTSTAPCPARASLTPEEVNAGYEHNTGVVDRGNLPDPKHQPRACARRDLPQPRPLRLGQGRGAGRVPCRGAGGGRPHGPSTPCRSTRTPAPAPAHVLEKHFQRKHGPNAYYGQR